jgi:NAD-dependent dihydropyrimidine dehydrogenase PreA subunit
MPTIVDEEKCDGCGTCVEECAVECITLEGDEDKKKAVINQEECTDCETCIDVCEQGAISMQEAE